jgi:hypothetical protein
MVGIWLPFVDAYEAGLWLFWIREDDVIAVPRPSMLVVDDRLHCESGPAVAWPNGKRYWFWRGVQVPQRVVEQPASIAPKDIDNEFNLEVRRVMLERYGPDRYMRDAGAELTHEDDCGRLWRRPQADDEDLVMVEVVNSTPEPDGSFKNYWLRVPPDMRSAKEAVAWTFNVAAERYELEAET